MAHSTVRIAAGASAVVASLLLVAPNPAPAAADKQGHTSNDNRKSGGKGSSGFQNRSTSNVVKDVIDGFGAIADVGSNSKPDLAPPRMELGTSGGDLEGPAAMRSAAVTEAPVGDNVTATSVPGGGSDHSGQAVVAFRSTRVTIGNGRTPGDDVGQARGAVLAQESLMSPEATPAAIEIDIPPFPPPLPPVERIRSADLVVGEFGYGTTDTVTDPLAGVAGLILLPAIGAVLGYRQARTAQSLRESLRA